MKLYKYLGWVIGGLVVVGAPILYLHPKTYTESEVASTTATAPVQVGSDAVPGSIAANPSHSIGTSTLAVNTIANDKARSLAQSCSDAAFASMVVDPSYGIGPSTSTTSAGTCTVFSAQFNTPEAGFVTMKTHATVKGGTADITITKDMRDAAKNWPHAFADAANQNPPKKSQQEAKADLVQELSRTQPQLFSIYKGTPGPYSLGLRDITDNLVTLFESGDKALIWAGTGKDYFAISRTTPGDQTDSFEVKDAKTLASVSEASGMVVGGQGNAFFVIVDYQAIYVYRSDDPSVLIVPGSQLSGRESYDRGGGFGGHIIAEDNITYEPITDISNLSISTYDTTRDAINDTNTQVIHRKMRDLNFPLNPDQFPNYYRLPQ